MEGNKGKQGAMEETMESLLRSLGILHQLNCSVSSFTLPSHLDRLNGLMKEMDTMQAASQECNLQIPVEVIKLIDEGKNPDEFTKDLLDHCVQRNQATKGKVDSFKTLRKNILEQVEETFPEETEAYRMLRTASAMESRKALQAAAVPGMSNGVKAEH